MEEKNHENEDPSDLNNQNPEKHNVFNHNTKESEEDKSSQLALLDIMDEIEMPIDYEFIEKAGEINSNTLQRIKILLLATKELINFHNKLKLQINTLESQESSLDSQEDLTIRVSKNLKQLELTRLKNILEDLIERFLIEQISDDQDVEDVDLGKLKELEEYILNISNLQAVIESLKEDNIKLKQKIEEKSIEPTVSNAISDPERNELNNQINQLNEALKSKNIHISELEGEIQEKIRIIETNRNEIQKINDLEEQNNHLENLLNEYKEKLQESTTEYDILKEESNILQNRINQIESELERSKETNEELNEQIKDIEFQQDDFNQITEDYEKLLEEKHEFQTKLSETMEKLEHHENDIHEAQNHLKKLKEENYHLQNQLTLKDGQIDELTSEIKLKNEDISNLRNQITSSQDNNESLANFDKELAEKDLLISDLQAEIRNYENKLTNMVYREELEQYKEQISTLEKQLEEKKQKIQKNQEEIVNLRGNFSDKQIDYQKQIDDLKEELSKKSELESLVKEKEAALMDYEKQEEEFHEALLDKVRITAEKEDLNEKINELIEQKRVLYERIQQLNNRDRGHLAIIERLEKKVTHLESQLEETKEISHETIKEKVEREFLEGQIEKLNKEVRDQIALASEAKGKYDIIRDQIEQINQKNETLFNENERLKQENKLKERQYEDQILQLNQELDDKAHEIKEIRQKLDELTKNLEIAASGEEFKEEINSLKLDLQEQQQIAESLAEEISKKEFEKNKMENENDRLSDEMIQLKRRIKILRRDLAHK